MIPLVRAAAALKESYGRLWRACARGAVPGAVQIGKSWYVPTTWVRVRLEQLSASSQEVAAS